jgi:hypothetical protein
MKKAEFDHLLACYGADFGDWPGEQRGSAKRALDSNPEWQASFLESRALDDALDEYTLESPHLAALEQRILAETVHKQSILDRFIQWLIPGEALWRPAIWRPAIWRPAVWRPALVACLPIIVGVSIGLNINIDEQYTLEEELSLTGLVAETSTLTPILEINDE